MRPRAAAAAVLLAGCSLLAQEATAPVGARMSPSELTAALDGWLAPQASSGAFAGVVLVAKEGTVIFERAYGTADREHGTPMSADLRFSLASIGKAFTKVAVGQLVQAGKLKFTDTIGALLPDYPNPDARSATVAQLLTHRGGIVDFFGPEFDGAPKERFRANADYFTFVAPRPLLFPPGTRNQYCNGCYIVLGEIVAKVAGMPYERYVEEHVFSPAGMKTAGFLSVGDSKVARPYTRRRGDGVTPVPAVGMHGVRGSAAGGSFARAADLLAFDQAVRSERLLNAVLTDWFYGNLTEAGVPDALKTGTAPGGLRGLGIAGGAPGMNASLEAGPEWTIVVVGNLDPPNASQVASAIRRALR
jgi:D-alanyl-D-alanine carboxypeptidase